MDTGDGFVEALLAAPVGVALLAVLEQRHGRDDASSAGPFDPDRCRPETVTRAADAVGSMAWGELLDAAVFAGVFVVGPWILDGPDSAAGAYRRAEARAPIARAVADRFGPALHAPIDRGAQQWWTSGTYSLDRVAPLFQAFEQVYDAGQFTWAGLWTVTDPPPAAHLQLVDAWELPQGPITRWHLPVLPSARVFEIHRPADWCRLVAEHPRPAASHLEHWELPGRNQDPSAVAALMAVPGQRAARTSIRHHLVPDWRSVAGHYDAVHLSWAGFLTAEGCITDLGEGDVAMLRYWFSERTHWLVDAFGDPTPAPAPALDDSWLQHSPPPPPPPSPAGDAARLATDADALHRLLGRPVPGR